MSSDLESVFTAALSLDDPELPDELHRRSADVFGAISWSQLRVELS